MRFKLIFVSVLVTFILAGCSNSGSLNKSHEAWISEPFTDSEQGRMTQVDDTICLVVESDVFINADLKTRRQLAKDVLIKLKASNLIKSYYCSDDACSFEYIDGVLGGIQIKDFGPMMNGI